MKNTVTKKHKYLDDLEKKLNLDDNDLNDLKNLSHDKNSDIRYRIAELLVNISNESAENILLTLLHDKDKLVRINACDSLCNYSTFNVIQELKKSLFDDYYMVRGYAVLSLTDIYIENNYNLDELVKCFISTLENEPKIWVKINYYVSLYKLGSRHYLNNILENINNRTYHNRYIAISGLYEIMNQDNYIQIIDKIINSKKKETELSPISEIIDKIIKKSNTYK